MTKHLYILPLLAALTFSLTAQAEKLMTKEEFCAKHNIVGDSLIPPSFDMEELKRKIRAGDFKEDLYLKADSDEEAEKTIQVIKAQMEIPPVFEGFYPPKEELEACEREDKICVASLGLTEQELAPYPYKRFSLDLSKEEKQRIYGTDSCVKCGQSVPLIGRLGDNIYFSGNYGYIGGYLGADITFLVRENGQLKEYYPYIDFICSIEDNQTKHTCTVQVSNTTIIYDPYNRFDDVWDDYIAQYIQKESI